MGHRNHGKQSGAGAIVFILFLLLIAAVGGWHYLCDGMYKKAISSHLQTVLDNHLPGWQLQVSSNPISNLMMVQVVRPALDDGGLLDLITDGVIEEVLETVEPRLEREIRLGARGNLDIYALIIPYEVSAWVNTRDAPLATTHAKLQPRTAYTAPTQKQSKKQSSSKRFTCAILNPDSGNYMEEFENFTIALGENGYIDRYQIDLVLELCKGDLSGADRAIDRGFVSEDFAIKAAMALGISYRPKPRSSKGIAYGNMREALSSMGLCNACLDSVINYVTKMPGTACAELAEKALAGDMESRKRLGKFPEYCEWKYAAN